MPLIMLKPITDLTTPCLDGALLQHEYLMLAWGTDKLRCEVPLEQAH